MPYDKQRRSAGDIFAGGGEMGALMRAFNWADSPLGPVEEWPRDFCAAIRIALDSRYPMALWLGPENVLLYNDAWRPILGRDKHPQGLGRPGWFTFPEIWHLIGAQMKTIWATGKAMYFDDLLLPLHRSGYLEEVYFTYSYSPIRDEQGETAGIFTAVVETTDRVLEERRSLVLRRLGEMGIAATDEEACAKVAAVLAENNHDVPWVFIYLVSSDNREATVRASAGVKPGSSFTSLRISLDGGPEDRWQLRHVFHSKRSMEIILPISSEIPTEPWGEPSKSAIVIPIAIPGSDTPVAIILAGINVRRVLDAKYSEFFERIADRFATALVNSRAYEMERKRAESLAQLDRAKTQFFSNVSHEFRTPLTLMLGPLEKALSSPSRSLSPNDLELMYRNGLRLFKLVNTLLDFSRIEAGRAQASFAPTNFASLTADVASVFRSATEGAGIELVVECSPLAEPVYVDRDMWEKIVLNLLSNALKFTWIGKIAVTLRKQGRQAELKVQDTGVGIPKEQLPRVFERFHRVEGACGRTQEGTGIGLAFVQELVKLHGGSITLESELGMGTTATVSIPFGNLHLPKDRICASPQAMQGFGVGVKAYANEAAGWISTHPHTIIDALEPFSRSPEKVNARILLADDNADMRQYIKDLLAATWAVESVPNGAEALRAAKEEPPDLILTDVMMPVMDGFELLRQIRSDPKTKDIPLIMLSARAGEEAKVGGFQAGVDDYILKPFSARELHARVQGALKIAAIRKTTNAELEARVCERTKELSAILREKESLLKEIHHRVKNNLQVTSGLLSLQANSIKDPATKELFLESKNRIKSLAMVHEKLCQSENLSEVDMASYIQSLVPNMLHSYSLDAKLREVRTELHLERVFLPIEKAVPFGLILNELVSNIGKHAFPSGRSGKIWICLGMCGTECILTVGDDGVKIPPEIDPKTTQTLGLSLVHSLTHQLSGKLELNRDGRTEFTIRFDNHRIDNERYQMPSSVAPSHDR